MVFSRTNMSDGPQWQANWSYEYRQLARASWLPPQKKREGLW
jgi:hypothetical protein